jgi:chitodextrinase
VALSWQGASDNVGVTGYRVFRGTTQIATLGSAVTSYTDAGLGAGSYSYTVRAVDAAGNLSDPSNTATATVPDTTKPSAPPGFTATGSAGQVALAWQASSDNVGVTGYRLFRGGTPIATLGAAARSHTDSGLAAGPYTYTLRAVDAAGNESDPSTATGTVPDTTKPTVPGGVTATSTTSAAANVSWQASQDNVGVTGYRVYRNGSLLGTAGAAATTYSDTSVAATVTYRYVVRAIDGAGNESDPSNEGVVTVPDTVAPASPGNLRTTAVTPSGVDLAWNGSTDNVAVTGYRIFREGIALATVGAGVTTYSDTGVPAGTHGYTVRAFDAAGNLSGPSNGVQASVPDVAAPTIPQNLVADPGGPLEVDLTWDASTDNLGVAAYLIYRDDVHVDTVGATSHTDTVPVPGNYTYRVRAVDEAGNLSDPSNADQVTVLVPDFEAPTIPGNLRATRSGDEVTLTWIESTDNVGVTGYRMYRNDAWIGTVTSGTEYVDTNVPSRDHEYIVRAQDAFGNLSEPSNPFSLVVPDTEPPAAPTGLSALTPDGGPVRLSWDEGADNVGIAQYEVHRDGALIATLDPRTAWTDQVGPGTYTYRMKALDPAGNVSPESEPLQVTVLAPDTEKPTAPGNLQSQAGPTRVDLQWQASSDNRAVTGYEIRRDGTVVATTGATTSWSDTSVAASHSYEYVVRALDAAGNVSDPSNTVNATVPDTQKPSAPGNLVATGSANRADLAWNASSDNVAVTGYNVYRDGSLRATVGAVTSWSDTSVTTPGHDYQVRAFDAAGNVSDPSNTAHATVPDTQKPTAPGNVAATAAGPNQVNITWSASTDNIGVTGYNVYRDGNPVATLNNVTSFSDTGVAGSTTYQYVVRARDAAGNLSDPGTAPLVTTPSATQILTFAPQADARVHSGSPTTNYGTSYLRADGGTNPVESMLRFTVSGATAGTIRSAKLRMHAYSGTVDGPAVFTTNPAWDETTINWNTRPPRTSEPTDDKGAIATNSWVEYDVTPFVTANGTYSFGIASTVSDGVDIYSREAATLQPELVVTTGPPDTQKPSAPSGLAGSAVSPGQVDLSWNAASDDVGVTGYRVYRNGGQIAALGVTTAYSDTTASPNTSYSYTVRAVDAAGNVSDPSNSLPVTTPAGQTVLTLQPEADARTHEASPSTNYGTSYLRANGGTESDVESFLRFTLTGVPAGSVESARLRLYAYNGTVDGPALYTTATSWDESTLNWSTRPARTSPATGDLGAIPVNTWFEYDVTSFVTGSGTYSFTLATTSNDGVDFHNREAATLRPELVVTVR